jgi:hypothetical protein
MATLREYFDGDFSYAARVCVKLNAALQTGIIEVAIFYDFSAYTAFFACYVPGTDRSLEFFLGLIEAVQPGKDVALDGKVVLPSARNFPGELDIKNTNPFEIRARFHGDTEWIRLGRSGHQLASSFIQSRCSRKTKYCGLS